VQVYEIFSLLLGGGKIVPEIPVSFISSLT